MYNIKAVCNPQSTKGAEEQIPSLLIAEHLVKTHESMLKLLEGKTKNHKTRIKPTD